MRDNRSGALLNTDVSAYKAYIQQRKHMTKLDQLAQDVDGLKSELGDIKMLLTQILQQNGTKNG